MITEHIWFINMDSSQKAEKNTRFQHWITKTMVRFLAKKEAFKYNVHYIIDKIVNLKINFFSV